MPKHFIIIFEFQKMKLWKNKSFPSLFADFWEKNKVAISMLSFSLSVESLQQLVFVSLLFNLSLNYFSDQEKIQYN